MTKNTKLVSREGWRAKGVEFSATTWWRLIRDKKVPEPIRIGSKEFWLESEVDAWIAEKVAARDGIKPAGRKRAA